MRPAPGDVLAGRFVVEGPPLGHGATGTVLPAFDEVAAREVCLKLVHDHLLGDEAALRALQAEAGAAARFRHPHVLVVHGLWSHEGQWFLVTERIPGAALDSVAPLGPDGVVALGLEVARALSALHEAGHVHGDVRPGHVVCGERGAVLLGFGQRGARGPWASLPGQTAPEVALGSPPGVPADLYGLGVVLHVALTGRLPFTGATPWAVVGAQRRVPPPLPPGPRGLGRLVVDLLHPQPDRRPPSAEVVAEALDGLRRDPERVARFEDRVAPLGRTFAVHGTDPATGGPALVAAGMGKRRARALVKRLREQGWDVRADPEGLGLADLAWIVALGLAAGAALPVLGIVLGLYVGTRWRSDRTRPRLRRALPPVEAAVPPRKVAAGTEQAIFAGLMLLVGAALLAWWPELAVVPALLFLVVLVDGLRVRRRDHAERAARGRLATVLAEARHALEHRVSEPDRQLALQGELEALEREAPRLPREAAIGRAEELLARAVASGAPAEDVPDAVVAALRRTWAEPTSTPQGSGKPGPG